MIRLDQWLSDSRRQQYSFLLMSGMVLLYSVINLVVHEKIISIVFIFLAFVLFILSVLYRRANQIHGRMMEHIRLIQKDYDSKKSEQVSNLSRLNKKQRQLWQYIVTDYSTDELQHIFSLTQAGLAKEIKELVRMICVALKNNR